MNFKNLGIAIIDEQHKFGVAQRSKLWHKNDLPPHVLIMTATPIPRTLAMSAYGDLDMSIINELPPGRKEINTIHQSSIERLKLIDFLKTQIDNGRQAYIVYPLIEESKKMDLKFLEDGMECDVVFYEDKPISVELPNSVVREITYTEPAVKGDTTSGKVLKQAKISTDFELMVPLFCETGDKIEIDTRTFEYKNRVK